MNKNIKIAIVGCGRVAAHYQYIFSSQKISGYVVVGVCDIDPVRAHRYSAYYACEGFTDYIEMLKICQPDLVVILTPSGLHYEHAKIGLESGFHVLTEKPIVMRPNQAVELIKLANSKNLFYGVVFQNRLNPAINALKKAYVSGRFGKIISATIRLRWSREQAYYEDDWHGTWSMDGGVINQQAIHHVDALNWIVGPVSRVCASMANRVNNLEAEDTLVAAIEFENGALGTIEATTALRPSDIEASISIVGESGVVVVGGVALNKIETWQFTNAIPGDDLIVDRCSVSVPNGYGLSHGVFLQQVFDYLMFGGDVMVLAQDGLATTRLIHALYASVENNCWVDISHNVTSAKLGVINVGE